jgi:RNA polymerase sigma factor (sigma-70 family)
VFTSTVVPVRLSREASSLCLYLLRALFPCAARLCRNEADAEEAVSETVARLVHDGVVTEFLAEPEKVRRYAFGYLPRVVSDTVYRYRTRTPIARDRGHGPSFAPPLDEMRGLRVAFAMLSKEEQELLWAVDVEEESQLDIAQRTGTPAGTIRSRVTRTREKLRSFIVSGVPAAPLADAE